LVAKRAIKTYGILGSRNFLIFRGFFIS